MEIHTVTDETTDIFYLHGRFDYSALDDFRLAANEAIGNGAATRIDVDLGNVDYMDSAGLGALLMLQDMARQATKELRLVSLGKAAHSVRHTLELANSKKLFVVAD